jgi:hypothetical protein
MATRHEAELSGRITGALIRNGMSEPDACETAAVVMSVLASGEPRAAVVVGAGLVSTAREAPRGDGDCPACLSGYHGLCHGTLNDGTLCDCAQVGHPRPLPLHRTEAGYPRCSTCDGGGCPDCTDPA